jgi:hypothetical protein
MGRISVHPNRENLESDAGETGWGGRLTWTPHFAGLTYSLDVPQRVVTSLKERRDFEERSMIRQPFGESFIAYSAAQFCTERDNVQRRNHTLYPASWVSSDEEQCNHDCLCYTLVRLKRRGLTSRNSPTSIPAAISSMVENDDHLSQRDTHHKFCQAEAGTLTLDQP